MEYDFNCARTAMHVVQNNLIVMINEGADDIELGQMQKEILSKMESTNIRGVLVDVSRLRVIDSVIFSILSDTTKMVSLLGGKAILFGFQAGAASSLVDLGVDLSGIDTAATMDDGIDRLHPIDDISPIEEEESKDTNDDESEFGDVAGKSEYDD